MVIRELPNLHEIKVLRKQLGLTQQELSSLAGVDRGTIGQLESGWIKSCNYETIRKIFGSLYSHIKPSRKPLNDICSKKIIFLSPRDSLEKGWKIMMKNHFDALPILDKGKLLGKVTIDGIHNYSRKKPYSKAKIIDVLEESPPTIPYKTPAYWIEKFLVTRGDCVLLTKKGKFVGIVTPLDLKFR